jgi:hypothetical protein
MRRHRLLVLVLGFGLIAVAPAAMAQSDQPSAEHDLAGVCHFNVRVYLSPGASITPGHSSFATRQPAPLDCVGTLDGHRITGRGTIETVGDLTGNCVSGKGTLSEQITLPTTNGEVHLESHATFQYVVAGIFKGTYLSGPFYFVPVEGDCLTAPLTVADARHLPLGEGGGEVGPDTQLRLVTPPHPGQEHPAGQICSGEGPQKPPVGNDASRTVGSRASLPSSTRASDYGHVQPGAVRIVETPGRLIWGFVCRASDQMPLCVA